MAARIPNRPVVPVVGLVRAYEENPMPPNERTGEIEIAGRAVIATEYGLGNVEVFVSPSSLKDGFKVKRGQTAVWLCAIYANRGGNLGCSFYRTMDPNDLPVMVETVGAQEALMTSAVETAAAGLGATPVADAPQAVAV